MESRSQNGNGSALCGQSSLMGCGVDAARQTADDRQARIGDLIGDLFRAFQSVVGSSSGPDDSDRVMVSRLKFTPDVKYRGRIMNLAQQCRVVRRLPESRLSLQIREFEPVPAASPRQTPRTPTSR